MEFLEEVAKLGRIPEPQLEEVSSCDSPLPQSSTDWRPLPFLTRTSAMFWGAQV